MSDVPEETLREWANPDNDPDDFFTVSVGELRSVAAELRVARAARDSAMANGVAARREAHRLEAELRAAREAKQEHDSAHDFLDSLGVPRTGYPDDPRGLVRDPSSRYGLAAVLTLKGRIRKVLASDAPGDTDAPR